MIRCKVNDSTAKVTVVGTTTQIITELLILNIAVMVELTGGKIYSHSEKVMLIAEKLSKVALGIEEE